VTRLARPTQSCVLHRTDVVIAVDACCVRTVLVANSGEMTELQASTQVEGFLEEDQVAAWTAAQDGATKSKQGLGRSGQPRKVAGARWQGTRTKLGSDDDASDDGASEGDDDATCVTMHRHRPDANICQVPG